LAWGSAELLGNVATYGRIVLASGDRQMGVKHWWTGILDKEKQVRGETLVQIPPLQITNSM